MHDLRFAERTDVGRERAENQDACGHVITDDLAVFFVCDGMGGYAGGSTASRLAVETITGQFQASEAPMKERITNAIRAANLVIHQRATEDKSLRHMGTTVVLLVIERAERRAWWAHVGDSRIYLLRGDVIRRLTRDHTMVQSLVDDGIISREEARNHPRSNVISRSLGTRPEVEVDVSEPFDLLEGDSFLLCSDGLHGLVEDEEAAHLVRSLPPEDAVERLIERANEEGGPDNITAQVVHIDDGSSWAEVETWQAVHPPILRERRRVADEDEDPAPSAAPLASPPPGVALDSAPVAADLADGDDDPITLFLLALLLGVVVVALVWASSGSPYDVVLPTDDAIEGSAEVVGDSPPP